MEVNRAQVADIFGVSKTTVDAWRGRGCPVKSSGGRGTPMVFDTVDVFNWLVEQKTGDGDDYSALLEFEKYREKKRQNDIEEGKLAPVNLLTDALHTSANQIIPVLESLPLIMKRNWPEITGDQVTLVKKSIAECRNTIARSELSFD